MTSKYIINTSYFISICLMTFSTHIRDVNYILVSIFEVLNSRATSKYNAVLTEKFNEMESCDDTIICILWL